jgi:2-keto-3-deoxy-L-rhamnonate aldolase RhmA
MFEKNRLTAMVRNKQVPLGMQCFTADPALIEVLGLTGFDFVMIDTEHSGNNPRALEDTVRVADGVGLITLVRVSEHSNTGDIHRALEAGAHGVFLPLVNNVEDVRAAADAAYFPPKGTRGICPSVRAARYNWKSFEQYSAWNNAEVLLIPMIERPSAVDNIDEICALDEVQMLVFAAGDLAYAMNEGSLMMESKLVQEAYRKVLDAAKRHNVAVIGGPLLDPTPAGCRKALDDGVKVFCLGLDVLGFRRICEQYVGALNAGISGTDYSRAPAPASGFKG